MRRRLAVMAVATTSMVVLAFVIPLGVVLRDMAADRAMTKATLEAQSLVSVLAAVPDAAARSRVVDTIRARSGDRVTLFAQDGTELGDPAPRDTAVTEALRGRAMTRAVSGGKEVVVPMVGGDGNTLVVRVAVPRAQLRSGVSRAWLLLALVAFTLIALTVIVADGLARSITRPIAELAATARRVQAGDLAARASTTGPKEVQAVSHALNQLAQHILDLVAAEREALADLSHRLRTPLTALRLEAETIDDPRDAARVGAATEELARAVDDLIAEARRRPTGDTAEIVDVVAVVRDRAEFWSALAEEQGRSFSVNTRDSVMMVNATHSELCDAVDALLGNVFAHTPEGTAFDIAVRQVDNRAVMTVDDHGPGFAAADVVRRGVSGAGSSGLGLDIARRVAQRAGGSLRLGTSPGGGARVVVLMPTGPPRFSGSSTTKPVERANAEDAEEPLLTVD